MAQPWASPWEQSASTLPLSLTHLHGGGVASVGSGKPAVGGALVNVNILQIDVNAHHAPARHTHT